MEVGGDFSFTSQRCGTHVYDSVSTSSLCVEHYVTQLDKG